MCSKIKNSRLFRILIIVLTLFICFILIDYFIILSSKNNINKFINNSFNLIINNVTEVKEKNISSIVSKGNLTINSNIEKYSNIKDYGLIYDIEFDKKNNAGLVDLKLGDIDESLAGKLLYSNENLYVSFPYLISSTVKLSSDIKYNNDINCDDIIYLITNIKNGINNNINYNNLSKKISGYNIETTYKIKVDNFNNIIDTIYKDNKSKSILENNFNVFIENIKMKNDIDLIVYTNIIGKIVKVELYNKDIHFIYDFNYIKLFLSDNEVFNANIDGNNIKGNIYYKNGIINYDLNISNLDNGINIDGKVTINVNDKKIDIDIHSGISVNVELSKIDVSDSKSINQLTDKDLNAINKTLDLLNNYFKKQDIDLEE